MAYPVSELYKEAIDSLSRTTKITGTLTTKGGTVIDITNEKIDAGSLYITNQCVSSDAFQYGSVFAAEAGITLKTDIDRYSLFDAKLVLNFSILLSNNEYETIPLGEFYVNEPARVGKSLTIKAYDNMLKLDKDIEESTEGTIFDMLSFISQKCEVDLAQTQDEIEALTNGTLIVSLSIERVSTYREFLSYLALVTCTYAAFDRQGKLKLYTFENTPSKIVDSKIRVSSKFSDFESYHTSIKALFLESGAFNTYISQSEFDDGLLYDIKEVPIVQGLRETNQAVLDNMLSTLSELRFVPSDFSFNGDPSVELGDMIECIDREGDSIPVLVTFYKWTYRGRHQIKGAGLNPKLSHIKEKKSGDLSAIEAEINKKSVITYPYTNGQSFKIKGHYAGATIKEVIKVAFASIDSGTVLFVATIQFSLDRDGYVILSPYLDGTLDEKGILKQYCQKGDNFVTISSYIPVKANMKYRYSVAAETAYVESFERKSQAELITFENAKSAYTSKINEIINALKTASSIPITSISDVSFGEGVIDTTIPTMVIEEQAVKAVIFGQGLSAKVEWDGTLTFSDIIPDSVSYDKSIKVVRLSGSVSSSLSTNAKKPGLADKVGRIPISTKIKIRGLSERMTGVGVVILEQIVTFELNEFTMKDERGNIVLFEGAESQVLMSKNYDMSDSTILGVEKVNVVATPDVIFAISADNGESWYMWTGSAWGLLTDEITGMTADTISNITAEQWAMFMTSGQYKVRMSLLDMNSSFTSFVVDYIN